MGPDPKSIAVRAYSVPLAHTDRLAEVAAIEFSEESYLMCIQSSAD